MEMEHSKKSTGGKNKVNDDDSVPASTAMHQLMSLVTPAMSPSLFNFSFTPYYFLLVMLPPL